MLPSNLNLYCMMHSGKHLSDPARQALMGTAVRMHERGIRNTAIRMDDCSGTVKSLLEPVEYCDLYGLEFEASVLTPEGHTFISFFVPMSVLDTYDPQECWEDRLRISIQKAKQLPIALPPGVSPESDVVVMKFPKGTLAEDVFSDDYDDDIEPDFPMN